MVHWSNLKEVSNYKELFHEENYFFAQISILYLRFIYIMNKRKLMINVTEEISNSIPNHNHRNLGLFLVDTR